MRKDGFVCDECGVDKREANHWFIVTEDSKGLRFAPWDQLNNIPPLVLVRPEISHLCGRECAQKVLERWMEAKR